MAGAVIIAGYPDIFPAVVVEIPKPGRETIDGFSNT
jgi:hypothetical protein